MCESRVECLVFVVGLLELEVREDRQVMLADADDALHTLVHTPLHTLLECRVWGVGCIMY